MISDETKQTVVYEAARIAGMVEDRDLMKMIDTSTVTVSDDGRVQIPTNFFGDLRRAKPHLFGKARPTGVDVRTASGSDYAAAKQKLLNEAR